MLTKANPADNKKEKAIKGICAEEIRIFQSYKHILKELNGLGPHIESIHMHILYMFLYILVSLIVLNSRVEPLVHV